MKNIKGKAERSAKVENSNVAERTIELSFSSEEQVQRWYGWEQLSHDPGAMDMTRLERGAPVLLDHSSRDQVGVVEKAWLDQETRKGRATVKFSRSARAQEILQDIEDGIRQNVSVGYSIADAKISGKRDGEDIYLATRWQPFEISIVSVPADTNVGVGRSAEFPQEATAAVESNTAREIQKAEVMTVQAEKKPETDNRSAAIMELAEKFGAPLDVVSQAIRKNQSVEEFQGVLLERMNKLQRPLSEAARDVEVGLTEREIGAFSFMKLIRYLADPKDKRAEKEAAFELEACRAAEEKQSNEAKKGSVFIPADVLTRAMNTSKDGLAAGNTGGYAIETILQTQSFIELLRNRTTVMQLASVMGGLVGNLEFIRQTAGSTAYWLGEDQDATQTGIEFGTFQMTPKTVAAYSEITRKLLMQSSIDVEARVRADLAIAMAQAIDRAAYYGTGSSYQPLGIFNESGLNLVDFAATQPTFGELVDMETEIAADNADYGSMAIIANPRFRGYAKQTLKFAGINDRIWEPGDTVNGYRTVITNQITNGHMILGNWADYMIGMWGSLQLQVDPYTHSLKQRLRLVVFQDVDFKVRRKESFCVGKLVP